MRMALIGAVASVALVSVTTAGLAQTPGAGENQGKAPGMSPGGSGSPGSRDSGAGERGQGSSEPGMKRPEGKAEGGRPAAGKSAQEGARDRDAPKSSERPGKNSPKASEGPADKQRPKASERPDTDKKSPKSTETRPEKGTPKSTETRPEKGTPKSTENRPEKGQSGRVQVSDQERTNVRERLMRDGRVQKTKINVRVNVGVRIPRSVRLLPLSVAIIGIAPSYRGYSYVVTEDDTICIVDPRSYEIVDVIATGTQHAGRSPAGARLTLSREQMQFISAHVSRERRANVHARLALGVEVPHDVELLAFPRDVMTEMPELERYRYIVAEDDVVIVDPSNRDVALVISE